MRKVYVINLDKPRIFLVLGFFFLLMGLAILAGYSLSPIKNQEIPATAIPIVKEADEAILKEKIPTEQGFLLPPEKPDLKENNLDIYTEDPFIKPPPSRKKKMDFSVSEKEPFYTIQVGAFMHEKDALQLKELLKKKGIEARVDRGSRYWFVRVGKSNHRDKLQNLAQKLKAENFEYLIKKIP